MPYALESNIAYGPENSIYRYLRDLLSVAELCELYGISRKTGYKWIDRYIHLGPAGLTEGSRRPQRSPNETAPEIVEAIIDARHHHPTWGAKKLLTLLHKRYPRWTLPGRTTVCDILSRNGLVPKKPRRRHIGHPGKPTSQILAPNDIWCADFKGQFKTRDGVYCYPLTVTDGFSRYLLGCQALYSTAVAGAKPVFARLFKEYGLPLHIRTDNGVPFATTTLARLSSLSAWWIRLGVLPQLIEPGKPQQNGRHERMHRTLKAETTRPAAANLAAQQRKSIAFGKSLIMTDRMKPSIRKRPLRCMNIPGGRCRTNCRRWNIRIVSKYAMSAPMVAFAGTRAGSMFRSSARENMSA